jgi:CheY-like chemotaxis protein
MVFFVRAVQQRNLMLTTASDQYTGATETNRWRALVVDDIPSACRALGIALSSIGGQVTTAHDGAQAVELVRLARSSGLAFDLVVTDIQMPVMDGIQMVRQMRREGFAGPVIAISGADDTDLHESSLAAGCDEFHRKPLSLTTLQTIVSRYLPAGAKLGPNRTCMSMAVPDAIMQI